MRTLDQGIKTVQQRQRAINLSRQGCSANDIGHRLGIDPRTVRRWRAAFRAHGPCGLHTRKAPGKSCRLSRLQRHGLTRRLISGALKQGFFSDLWTCPRIVQLIRHCYGVRYHVDHIPRLMRSLGFTVQKPECQARERDQAAVAAWIDRQWQRIKKRSPRAEEP